MNNEQELKKKRYFAEEVGLFFEGLGLPRMAGRMLGWLLICDPPHQSMHELVEALSASKASISNTTRMLIEMGLIERISLPEYRYDHYRIRVDAWYQITKRRTEHLTSVRRLAERGLALLKNEDPSLSCRLQEMHATYAFFEQVLPEILERWEQQQAQKEPEI